VRLGFTIDPTSRRDCFIYAGINSVAALLELAIGDRYPSAMALLLIAVLQLLIGFQLAPMTSTWWPANAWGFLFLFTLSVVAIVYGHFLRGSLYFLTAMAGGALVYLNHQQSRDSVSTPPTGTKMRPRDTDGSLR